MLTLNRQNSARYRVDLAGLQAVCAANYLGMHKIFPALRTDDVRHIELDGGSSLQLEVIERGPYTSLVAMRTDYSIAGLQPGIYRIMVYHDVRMAEVVGINGQRKLRGRYPYPNRKMHQKDEKWQMNCFLGEWIRHSLGQGRTEWRAKVNSLTDCESRRWLAR